MEQITQKLKVGQINITEVPIPAIGPRDILVRNLYSCISVGTESSTISAARKGYLGKLKDRPEQARQVLEKLLTQGPVQTYRAVMKKLDAHSPLGYSCVGRVIGLGSEVRSFALGDFAACGGKSASHAEIVAVPEILAVPLNHKTDFKQAAYNTLGAIALQGVRQADAKLGETCAVIGLGLLGQLVCLLLKAAGIRVIGVDVSPAVVKVAAEHCADLAVIRGEDGAEERIAHFTDGMGCDAVIITAATHSSDPINFAGAIARKRGTIVVVGAVPTGFDREPHYYQKELSVKMSCSYGPGRYDPDYEEKGRDYPYGYVRWTERRNMQAFQELIASRRIDLSYLTTHLVKLEGVPAAYDMILAKTEPFLGVLIEYDAAKNIPSDRIQISSQSPAGQKTPSVSIGFVGAGSYAQSHLLPNIPTSSEVVLKGVLTATPTGTRSVADRFGFEFCTSCPEDILRSPDINTIFIATRHDTHGHYVIDALKAGKHVFVEKPLCLLPQELTEISQLIQPAAGTPAKGLLMVGFNRRFSPLSQQVKVHLRPEPMAMVYRINAGSIPKDSWIQDPDAGGGRVLGEVCHFVDYLTFLCGSLPVSVHAVALKDPALLNDTLSITLSYENGSIGSIHYFANGSRELPKEYVEIYQSGLTTILNDFREATLFGKGRQTRKKLWGQDKGQSNEISRFIETVENGGPPLIPYDQLCSTTQVGFKILESLQTRSALSII